MSPIWIISVHGKLQLKCRRILHKGSKPNFISRFARLTKPMQNARSTVFKNKLRGYSFWNPRADVKHVRKYFSKFFIFALVLSFSVNLAMLLFGAARGYSADWRTLMAVRRENDETYTPRLTAEAIFINNSTIVLITFVPLLGLIWMPYVIHNTGFFAGALARIFGYDYIPYALRMFQDPIGILEFAAYFLALGESITILHSIFKGEGFREGRIFQHSWKTILAIVLFLIMAALLEAAELGSL